jgi:phage terminase large subunit-like protein
MTVTSSGLTVLSGGIQEDGNVIMASGTVSIASPHASSGLAVEAAVSAFTGNAIIGRVPQGSSSNALKLERGSPLFTVRIFSCFKGAVVCVRVNSCWKRSR